jgi:alpha-glucosidase
VPDDIRLARYVRPDELNLSFNFELVVAAWGAETLRKAIDSSMSALAEVGAPCTWVLGNHDVDRPATRYGGGAVGLRRARAAALVQLSLPGAVYLYNGEELGLSNVDLPDAVLQDPTWERSGHTVRGRDGERVPLPWSGDAPPYGFTTASSTWLPMPPDWAGLTAAAETADPGSTLSLFRVAIGLRRAERDLIGGTFEWAQTPVGVLAYRRGSVTVVLNASAEDVALPAGEVLVASGPLHDGALPPDTAVWIR